MLGQDSWERTAGTWQLGQESLDRTRQSGKDSLHLIEDRTEQIERPGHDSKDRTGTGELGTRVLEQDSQGRTTGAGKPAWTAVQGNPR
jgi:hypothetical protein